ncbi:MAG: hypothetical protein K6F68_00840 [Clostridiales bacterium]|nr:hypothetical protein [Clostridiales bacterium]
MLDNEQLQKIGFRFVTDSVELMTPYGEELKRRARFYGKGEEKELEREQENIGKLVRLIGEKPEKVNAILRLLMPVKDIRRSIGAIGERTLTEVELFEIKRFLLQLELLAPETEEASRALHGIRIVPLPGALSVIDPDGTRSPSFYVSDRLSERLSEIRRERKLLDEEMKKYGNKEELVIRRTRIAAMEEDENARVRGEITERLVPYKEALLENTAAIARLDFALGKARLAEKTGAVMPRVGSERFALTGMTNPRYSAVLSEKGLEFMPVSLLLERGSVVITGANMGGKSVAIKTLALNVTLAMCGYFVFADAAELPYMDDICMLSEDREDVESGLSTFGGEMKAFDAMLSATRNKGNVLVLLDEFARGTNPFEGAKLVKAAARLFNERTNTFAVIATHFDGVSRLAKLHFRVAGLKENDPETLRARLASGAGDLSKFMDYGLYPVPPDEEPPRDAVKIIKALGVSREYTDLIDN